MYDTRKFRNVGSESADATRELSERFTSALKASWAVACLKMNNSDAITER